MISVPHRPQSGRSFLLCFCRSTPNLCIFPIRTIFPSSLNIFQNYGVTSDPRISAMTTVRWNLVSSVVSPAMCCGIRAGADRADPLPGSSPYSVLSSIRRMILHLYKKAVSIDGSFFLWLGYLDSNQGNARFRVWCLTAWLYPND